MIRGFLHRLTLFAAAIIVAAVSIQSAARMVPDPGHSPELAVWLANGASLHDICGEARQGGARQHCPFCHTLGDTPAANFAPGQQRLALRPAFEVTAVDLRLGPQHGNPNVSARAPPIQA